MQFRIRAMRLGDGREVSRARRGVGLDVAASTPVDATARGEGGDLIEIGGVA